MLKNGLKLSTIFAIIKQILNEKIINKKVFWKRAALLDRVQMDLFKSFYQKNNYDFTTFFANSTAHLQHGYWRYMEPEAFLNKPSDDEINLYSKSVFFGYQNTDRLLKEMMEMVDDDTMLILASALSQQPFIRDKKRRAKFLPPQ